MSEPVDWLTDGTPRSARFADRYRSEVGGRAQADHVFLQGCGLPDAWASQQHYSILETGFGLGLNFLTTWHAWRRTPARPGVLHFVSLEAWPVSAVDLLRGVADEHELLPLAGELAAQWAGLLPGLHRLSFDNGHVLLTLCVGDAAAMLRTLAFEADAVFLDGFSPPLNPQMWERQLLQSVARCCKRGARVATWTVAREVRDGLGQAGFIVDKAPGLPPKRDCLQGVFDPPWQFTRRSAPPPSVQTGRCAVIGAGLAGASVAASLARRGWEVHVYDAASEPAQGASGLLAGTVVPQASPDDNVVSRLSRRGIRITLQEATRRLQAGVDWEHSGVLERRFDASHGLPAAWPAEGLEWTQEAGPQHLAAAGLGEGTQALWHAQAAWIKLPRLVQAWLADERIHWHGSVHVAGVRRASHATTGGSGSGPWELLTAEGSVIDCIDFVVVAAANGSGTLLEHTKLPLQPVRGQVTWGSVGQAVLPATAVNGHGSFIPAVPHGGGVVWIAGAAFQRDNEDNAVHGADDTGNLKRLSELLPDVGAQLAPQFGSRAAQGWAGVRCASPDRLPMVGPLEPGGPWLCTAMGSRGLTLAALCAELLAARLHGEPLPLERKLADALDAARWRVSPEK